MVVAPPGPTVVMVPQPTAVTGHRECPPSYNTTFGVTAAMPVTSGPGPTTNYTYQQYQPPAGYPSPGNNFQDPAAGYGQKSGVPAP